MLPNAAHCASKLTSDRARETLIRSTHERRVTNSHCRDSARIGVHHRIGS